MITLVRYIAPSAFLRRFACGRLPKIEIVALAALFGAGAIQAAEYPGAEWARARPGDVALLQSRLQLARAYALQGGGSGLIIRHGKLVMEWGDPAQHYDLKSTTKSIGVTLLGIALKDGKVRLDDPAIRHQPALGASPDSNKETGWLPKITLRHLANQVAGFEKPGGYGRVMFEPGTKWHYSDAGPNWLAECLTLAYGRDLNDVIFERVFTPIGIKPADIRWRENAYRPHEIAGVKRREFGAGFHGNVHAMARIGYLYLRNGRWNDQQIIPPEFVQLASQPAKEIVDLPEHEEPRGNASAHYSLLWWNNGDGTIPALPRDAFWSSGLGNSHILVIPSLDIVAVRAGKIWPRRSDGHYDVIKPFFEHIALAAASGTHGSIVKPSGPPYPPSPVIQHVNWAPVSTIVRQAKGSDIWATTWADDDALYTAYGDGRGFEPFVSEKLSLGISRVTGMPPDIKGLNLSARNGEFHGDGPLGRKASGMLMVDGVLYMLVRNVDNSQLAWSRDHGASWTWADWKFTTSFGAPTFLNFDKNYANARDNYVYIYSLDGASAYEATDRMVLARVPKDRIAEQAAYEYFVARDAAGVASWSRDIARRGAVFTNLGNCYRSGVTYNAGLKRYLWCQVLAHSTHPHGMRYQGGFGIYDAPEPWGPWTTVFYTEDWDVGPGETASIPAKWMSHDGRTVHLLFSGDDSFSVRQAKFALTSGAPKSEPSAALTLTGEPGVLIVQSTGAAGAVGIPSWKIVLRQDQGGSMSALHVPADSPRTLSARENSLWPIAGLVANTREDLRATMSRGREAFAGATAETFEVVENSPDKIVVRTGGPSRHQHYEHHCTYTFTPGGVQIEGEVLPLVDLRGIGVWGTWDRRQLADSHIATLPVRTQGRPSWKYIASNGGDSPKPLPPGVKYPFEAELKLRRPTPTFIRFFIDRNFEAADPTPLLIHNDKNMTLLTGASYEKLISFKAGAVAKGQRQTYKVRFEFETQQWP